MTIILKIPFDLGLMDSSKRGTADAPDIVQEEANDIFLSETGVEWSKKLSWTSVELNKGDFDETSAKIEAAARAALKSDKLIAVGGDHSVSYGVMKAAKDKCKKLIYFDAHLDCQDDFLPPSHEDILRAAISEKIFLPENILVIGVRNFTKEEKKFVEDKKIKVIYANEAFEKGISWLVDEIRSFCKGEKTYISIDIDVVDPAFAPGTGWREPGGLSSRELIFVLQNIAKVSAIQAADIVEISPKFDQNRITARLGAKIISEIATQ